MIILRLKQAKKPLNPVFLQSNCILQHFSVLYFFLRSHSFNFASSKSDKQPNSHRKLKALKMKKQLLIIAIILFSLHAYADDKKIEYRSSNLKIAMYEYEQVNSLKLSLNIAKDKGMKAKVKLMDAEGTILHEEVIGRKPTAVNVRLDLSSAPTGKYYVELTSGDRIITKEVNRAQHSLNY